MHTRPLFSNPVTDGKINHKYHEEQTKNLEKF